MDELRVVRSEAAKPESPTQLDRIEQKLDELLDFKREMQKATEEFMNSEMFEMLGAVGKMLG